MAGENEASRRAYTDAHAFSGTKEFSFLRQNDGKLLLVSLGLAGWWLVVVVLCFRSSESMRREVVVGRTAEASSGPRRPPRAQPDQSSPECSGHGRRSSLSCAPPPDEIIR